MFWIGISKKLHLEVAELEELQGIKYTIIILNVICPDLEKKNLQE